MLQVSKLQSHVMPVPLLHSQLHTQLSQWIHPQDKRHLLGFSENVAAILQSKSACLSQWLSYLSHRDCQARSHMERLSYFVNNPKITPEIFYQPLIRQFLMAWEGVEVLFGLEQDSDTVGECATKNLT